MNILHDQFIATNVLVKFEDGSESYCVSRGVTLEDIAEYVDRSGRWHEGQPVSVYVRFKARGRERGWQRRAPLHLIWFGHEACRSTDPEARPSTR